MARERAASAVSKTCALAARRQRSSSLPVPRTAPRKLALLIGCNYKHNKDFDSLSQAHKDVKELKKLLIDVYHYEEDNITVLLDDGKHERPTRENIIRAMKDLVSNAIAGDKFFFHFSGHGEQTECEPGDKTEEDGMDEAIVPCDATRDKDTWVIDNEMNKLLVRTIPANAQLVAFFDMCHAGTALDLKHYCYNEEGGFYSIKRTSHDKVENKSRRLRELTSQQLPADAQHGPSSSAQGKRQNTRRFSYATKKSTMHYEVSELSVVYRPPEAARRESSSSRGLNTCSVCGKLRDPDGLDQPQAQAEDQEQNEQYFMPDRPAKSPIRTSQKPKPTRREEIHKHSDDICPSQGNAEGEGALARTEAATTYNLPTRRHTIASPGERKYECFSTLHLDWLPQFMRIKFGRLYTSDGEKVQKDNRKFGKYSRMPSLPSIIRFSRSSASASDSSVPASSRLSIVIPKPIKTTFNIRRSMPASGAPALDKIDENAPATKISHYGNVPLCSSPVPLSSSSTTVPTLDLMSLVQQQKCGCRMDSSWQQGGQVISIGAAHDEQLAWELPDRGEKDAPKTLTAALVKTLRKEAHPTFASLRKSIQTFLNEFSDDLRKYRVREKRHQHDVKLKSDAKNLAKHGQRLQKQTLRRTRSASESIPASATVSATTSRRNSHQAGNDVEEDIFGQIEDTIRRANGGPVQQVVLGSELLLNLNSRMDI